MTKSESLREQLARYDQEPDPVKRQQLIDEAADRDRRANIKAAIKRGLSTCRRSGDNG